MYDLDQVECHLCVSFEIVERPHPQPLSKGEGSVLTNLLRRFPKGEGTMFNDLTPNPSPLERGIGDK